MQTKHEELGMNVGTAQNRLVKDLLFSYVKLIHCYHCGGALSRDNFSIEHKEPWRFSENPKELFFDLSNISYSHISCNSSAARRYKLDDLEKAVRQEQSKAYNVAYKLKMTPEERKLKRQLQYRRTGK